MRLGEIATVCPPLRLKRKALSLQAELQRRADYFARRSLLTIDHHQNIEALQNKITNFLLLLDSEEFNSTTKNLPRFMVQKRSQVLGDCFGGIPTPGKAQYTEYETALVAQLKAQGQQQTVKQLRFELSAEIALRAAQGWYLIFNTLTARDDTIVQVFQRDSEDWRNYIEAVDLAAAQAAYGSRRKAAGKEYHSYLGVIEEGGKTGRLHFHVVHAVKALPHGSCDPNRGVLYPIRQCIDAWRLFWPHGNSTPKACRYSARDAYALAGWRWPLDKETGQPLVQGSPVRVASYLSKYLKKAYAYSGRTTYLWRTKKSRRLGRQLLSQWVRPLSNDALLWLATDTTLRIKFNRLPLPAKLQRTTALREWISRTSSRSLYAMTGDVQPRPSPLMRLRTGTPAPAESRQANAGSSGTQLLPGVVISDLYADELRAEIRSAAAIIAAAYFSEELSVAKRAPPISRHW